MFRSPAVLCFLSLAAFAAASAQTPKDVRAAAKRGVEGIPAVAGYLNSENLQTRIEAVRQLIAIGGKDTIDPLLRALRDADPEVQIRATDGLVNYYLPGYVKQGLGSTIVRAGSSIKDRFSDARDNLIDPFVIVRPDVITGLGQLARGGNGLDVRANACRAIGILRGDSALPDLINALGTKDSTVMYEALIAIQKIRDPKAGPQITYLLRDLDNRVQMTAIETAGLLLDTDALPTLRDQVSNPRNIKTERAALTALSEMPEAKDRDLLLRELTSKDDRVRAAAAEGLGRLGGSASEDALTKVWRDDEKMAPRLASAFALVLSGKTDISADSPLGYLIDTLNSGIWQDTAFAYLVEAARKSTVLAALYGPLDQGTKEEKIYLSRVLARSGDAGSVPVLDKASRDDDKDVAQEGLRALRSLRARLGI